MKKGTLSKLFAVMLAIALTFSLGGALGEAADTIEETVRTDFAYRAMGVLKQLALNEGLRLSFVDHLNDDASGAITAQTTGGSFPVSIFTEGVEPAFMATIEESQALVMADGQLYGIDFAVWSQWLEGLQSAPSYVSANAGQGGEAIAWLLEKVFEGAITTDGTTTVIRLSGRELVEALDAGVAELLGGDFDLSWLEEILTAAGANMKAKDLLALWKQADLTGTMPREIANAYCLFTVTRERVQMGMTTLVDGTITVADQMITCHLTNTYGRTANGYGYTGYATLTLPEDEPTLRLEYTLDGAELDAQLKWYDDWYEEDHVIRLFGHVGESVSLQLTTDDEEFYGMLNVITTGYAPTATLVLNYDGEKTMISCVLGESTQTIDYSHIGWYGTDTFSARAKEQDGMPVSVSVNWFSAYDGRNFSIVWNKTENGFTLVEKNDNETVEIVCEDDQAGTINLVATNTVMHSAYTDSEDKFHPATPETWVTTFRLTADEETPAIRLIGEREGEVIVEGELVGTAAQKVEALNAAEATFITPEMLMTMLQSQTGM